MLMDELRQRGQPTISHGLTIYTVDNLGKRHLIVLLESLA